MLAKYYNSDVDVLLGRIYSWNDKYDSSKIILAGGNKIIFFDLIQRKIIREIKVFDAIISFDISNDDKHIIYSGRSDYIYIYNLDNGEIERIFNIPNTLNYHDVSNGDTPISSVVYNNDNKSAYYMIDVGIFKLDLITGFTSFKQKIVINSQSVNYPGNEMNKSGNNKYLSVTHLGKVYLFNMLGDSLINQIQKPNRFYNICVISPDEKLICLGYLYNYKYSLSLIYELLA